jgi:ribosomal protein S18 acetylase RimI-like enzyme
VPSDQHVLDHPAQAALLGPHAHLAERRGRVLRYPPDVSPFLAFPDDPDDGDWRDLAGLVGPGALASLSVPADRLPPGWETVASGAGVQLVDDGVVARPESDAVVLGPADVAEMLALVERTRPGPFRTRTIEMGTYLGIRVDGRLVAMAGERLHPPGWTEISAVCTDAEHRGRGLATRLVRAVVAGIRDRGETPFLHAAATNTSAIRLYESLGFRLRRRSTFGAVRVPGAPATTAGLGQAGTDPSRRRATAGRSPRFSRRVGPSYAVR